MRRGQQVTPRIILGRYKEDHDNPHNSIWDFIFPTFYFSFLIFTNMVLDILSLVFTFFIFTSQNFLSLFTLGLPSDQLLRNFELFKFSIDQAQSVNDFTR